MLGIDKGRIICETESDSEMIADLCLLTELTARCLASVHGQEVADKVLAEMLGKSIANAGKADVDKENHTRKVVSNWK